MCKKISKILLGTMMCFLISFPININAQDYTLNDLIEKGKLFDKKEVIVKGEVIGEELERKDYSWININDTTNAMGIYMTKEDGSKVKMYGGYNQKGDTVEVVGTFNRACKEHGGDMDIHALRVNVVEQGKVLQDHLPKGKIISVIVLGTAALTLGYVLYKKSR
ncbi:hypothetical protein [Romboutsia sp.]|uniref:hypothetical protein n=1 Tax=Romboutsia sp. TaxID=1965302 RepID=UPI003F3EB521